MNLSQFDQDLLSLLRWLWQPTPSGSGDVQDQARLLLLDTIGCAIAGTAEPEVAALFRCTAAADPGPLRFPGASATLSTSGLARCTAAAACWHEACEGLAAAHGRPGLHAIPAVLGPALARSRTLGAVLDAVIAGFEIGGRMGMVCRIRPGMHVDGTWGSFGAATAACHLSGASPETALAALNHAACHLPFSLYWPIPAGSSARNAYAGHGATHGMEAATAAQAGLGGPTGSIVEMARLALGLDPADLPAMPGPGVWLLPNGYLKPYPAVRHVHYGAAAAEAWHHAAPTSTAAITAITLHVYQEALTYCGNRAPGTAIQAQFSLTYGVARSLAYGRLDPAAYAASSLSDPLVRTLENLIELQADPALTATNQRGCTLEVTAKGTVWRQTVGRIPGDPGLPMTRPEVLAKFMAYAAPVVGRSHAQSIAARLLDGDRAIPFSLDV